MTANLRITRKQAAEAMNVSERVVCDAARLCRTEREDLISEVLAGRMTVHRALIEAGVKKPPKKPTLFDAWNRATAEEQQALLNSLSVNGGVL